MCLCCCVFRRLEIRNLCATRMRSGSSCVFLHCRHIICKPYTTVDTKMTVTFPLRYFHSEGRKYHLSTVVAVRSVTNSDLTQPFKQIFLGLSKCEVGFQVSKRVCEAGRPLQNAGQYLGNLLYFESVSQILIMFWLRGLRCDEHIEEPPTYARR